jgi:hypothetical protein
MTPLWLQTIQATGAIATTVGVLIALYIALIRDPREASEEHKHHVEQMAALHRARVERFEAHARKLVPSCVRTPMLGPSSWVVRIDNAGNTATTILGVDVTGIDADGAEVPEACRQLNSAHPGDAGVDRSIRSGLYESLESALDQPLTAAVKQAIRDAVAVHFVNHWPRTLAPNHHAVMCYATTDPSYRLRVTIDYEDQAGFQWQRTDTTPPERTDDWHVQPATTRESW